MAHLCRTVHTDVLVSKVLKKHITFHSQDRIYPVTLKCVTQNASEFT